MIKKLLLFLLVSTVMFGQQTVLHKNNQPQKDRSHRFYRNFDKMMFEKYGVNDPDVANEMLLSKTNTDYQVGDTASWFAIDSGKDDAEIYQALSTCRAVTENCYVFVENAIWGTYANQKHC